MLRLSAFSDEISLNLDEQIRGCQKYQVTHIELRRVGDKNVPDFDAATQQAIRDKVQAAGMGVICIGSPIGKVKISEAWEPHFEEFKRCVALAEFLHAPFVRVFSYFLPEGESDWSRWRDEVMRRMRAKVEYVKDRNVVLLHENESHIYGDTGQRVLDLLKTIDHPKFRAAFDFANFVQVGEYPEKLWPLLQPFVEHIHIKDALRSNKKNVPAGQGDGHIAPILADAYTRGYRGFLTLEPHLTINGDYKDQPPELAFKVAVDALRFICREQGIPLPTAVSKAM